MQRQQDGLVPIGDALADLPGPVQALHQNPAPQRGFTLADQVNQLVGASEADVERGFMARTMALCSLPRSNPGNRHQYKRVNGPFKLIMSVTGDYKLPFGNLPHLILAWVCTEDCSGEVAGGLHAGAGGLQQQRRKVHPAPQSNEAAVWLQRFDDLRRQAR